MRNVTLKAIQKGFTLIELMIVVAIIGILAGIAIPSYQNYTISAKVSEGMVLADGLRSAISDYFLSTGTWPASNTTLGYTAAGTEFAGKYVSAITSTGTTTNDTILVTFGTGSNTPTAIQGKQIQLVGSQASTTSPITWICGPATGANAMPANYLPSTCNNN